MEGVRVDHLRCPTCGEPYGLPITIKHDSDEEDFDMTVSFPAEILSRPITPWRTYIECPNEHRWTVLTLWRGDHIDSMRLGQYIGGGDFV